MDFENTSNHSGLVDIITADFIFRAYVSPLLAIFGILGNVVVIIIFGKIRRNRFAVYSAILAVVNICILFSNTFLDDFLGRGIYYATNGRYMLKLDLLSITSCRLINFIPNAMYCSNAYILVALSVDRCLVLMKPFKYTVDKGVKEAIWTCCVIIGMASIVNIPLFYTYHLVYNARMNNSLHRILTPELECSLDDSFFSHFELYFKSIFTLALPTGIIICLNAFIIVKLTFRFSNSSFILPGTNNQLEQARFIGHLSISCLFAILFLPLSIVIIMRLSHTKTSRFDYSILKALSKLLSSIKDISFASNVFLYILFIPNFRNKFKQFIYCQGKQHLFRSPFGQICLSPLRMTLIPIKIKQDNVCHQ